MKNHSLPKILFGILGFSVILVLTVYMIGSSQTAIASIYAILVLLGIVGAITLFIITVASLIAIIRIPKSLDRIADALEKFNNIK